MDLSNVRTEIDRVDSEIRRLFMERMVLADQVACIKAQTEDVIYKPDREIAIIKHHTEGMKPELVKEYTALIKRIMEVSRKYQYGRTLELRDCFPFQYATDEKEIHKLAMLKEEVYACVGYSKDDVLASDSYEEIAEMIKNGEADAGMGIIEEVGAGVSDELHLLLMKEDLYMNSCTVFLDKNIRKKIVTFKEELVVLPEHNRFKIMFICPNHDGSLSSVLSMIADYGVNLTEIHSRPFEENNGWNYMFFTEIAGNIDTREVRALLYQLSQETLHMKILGSYFCEGDF